MHKIPIIVPAYKNQIALNKCIALCLEQSYQPVEIFVWDNSDENILFTRAINKGLRKFINDPEIQFLMILNQDAYLNKDTIRNLVKCMEKNPSCGIACPIQYSNNNKEIYWAGGLSAYPEGAHRKSISNCVEDFYKTYWANGAAMLLRAEMVREIGLMDENMEFIFSDSDYSFTARARGWDVLVCKNAHVTHESGQSGRTQSQFIQDVKIKDSIYFSKKWLSRGLYDSLAFNDSQENELDTAKHFFYLGLHELQQSRYQEAKRYFEKASVISPNRISIAINLSAAMIALGENLEAENLLKKSLINFPNNFDCLLNLAIANKNQQKYAPAIQFLNKALELDSRHLEALVHKGGCLVNLERFEEALRVLDQALELDSWHPVALIQKGVCLTGLSGLDDGHRFIKQGLQLIPFVLKKW